ncbi:MAG: SDR family oxidoreductase [Myxococcales bacterium]|nr:SDR family oxidoreductase [Myxococcales bacterium]
MSTVLVIGANRGIGLELARELKARGHEVIATCRSSSAALDALDVETHPGVDVTSDTAVTALRKALAGRALDGLIINAGILRRTALDGIDLGVVREQLEVNAIGPLRVAAALNDLLTDGGKLCVLTSRMGSIADNTSGGSYGYRMSKAAVNAMGMSLARDLAPRRIAVALLHPGYVRTEMTGNTGHVSADEAARALVDRFEALDMEHTGVFWHANGEVLPW